MSQDLRALVVRVVQRDRDAFAALYDCTVHLVYPLALRIVRHREDAEDVTAEVYAQAWRSAGQYDSRRGGVEGWLITMTRARAIDHLRARRARPDQDAARIVAVEDAADPLAPDDLLERCEARRRASKMLDVLDAEERRLVTLAFFEGFTHRELALLLHWPLGTVKTRIRASLLKMRGAAEADGPRRIRLRTLLPAPASLRDRAPASPRASRQPPLLHTVPAEVPA